MSLKWKKCFINVPLNDKGIEEHDNLYVDMPNVYSIALTDGEYDLLHDVFFNWNQKFDIIIDIFEAETLNAENCVTAMDILDRYINNNNNTAFNAAAEKLKEALTLALKLHMPVFLDF